MDLASPFPDVSRGPKGQQGTTQNLPRALADRGHVGDILSQCLPGLGGDERGRWEVLWVGERLALAPLIPSPPTLHLPAAKGGDNGEHKHVLLL